MFLLKSFIVLKIDIYILTNLTWYLLAFNFNYFDKKTFLDRIFNGGAFRAQSGIQDGASCVQVWAVYCFLERQCMGFLIGFWIRPWFNWFSFFLFYTLERPIKVCLQIFLVEACIVWKPVNWFAKQFDWMVSIWFRILMGVFSNRQ